jgi:acetoin utilization deacetylase AcuC-like enzyme
VEVAYITHPACLEHLAGSGHPERPDRLLAFEAAARRSGAITKWLISEPADRKRVEAVHDARFVDGLQAFSQAGGGIIDSDTWVDSATWDAALVAAGASFTALAAGADVSLLGIRPPGHHALTARAMGFCYLNNVAIAASYLRAQGERVAIVDWDVHHGNGTQASTASDVGVLYVSLHQSPFYPLTGFLDETGVDGTVVNLPLPAGTGGDVFRAAFERIVRPILTQFDPDRILVSSGFDAHRADPLADLALENADYGFMAHALRQAVPTAPILVFLEGGYDLSAIEASSVEMIAGLTGPYDSPTSNGQSSATAWSVIDEAASTLSSYWSL